MFISYCLYCDLLLIIKFWIVLLQQWDIVLQCFCPAPFSNAFLFVLVNFIVAWLDHLPVVNADFMYIYVYIASYQRHYIIGDVETCWKT